MIQSAIAFIYVASVQTVYISIACHENAQRCGVTFTTNYATRWLTRSNTMAWESWFLAQWHDHFTRGTVHV